MEDERFKSALGLMSSKPYCNCSNCNFVRKHIAYLTRARKGERDLCVRNGDRVLVQGEFSGVVKYVGDLDSEYVDDQVYIGVKLDEPIGNHDGTYKGKRYFTCPDSHGVIVPIHEVHVLVPADGRKMAISKLPGEYAMMQEACNRNCNDVCEELNKNFSSGKKQKAGYSSHTAKYKRPHDTCVACHSDLDPFPQFRCPTEKKVQQRKNRNPSPTRVKGDKYCEKDVIKSCIPKDLEDSHDYCVDLDIRSFKRELEGAARKENYFDKDVIKSLPLKEHCKDDYCVDLNIHPYKRELEDAVRKERYCEKDVIKSHAQREYHDAMKDLDDYSEDLSDTVTCYPATVNIAKRHQDDKRDITKASETDVKQDAVQKIDIHDSEETNLKSMKYHKEDKHPKSPSPKCIRYCDEEEMDQNSPVKETNRKGVKYHEEDSDSAFDSTNELPAMKPPISSSYSTDTSTTTLNCCDGVPFETFSQKVAKLQGGYTGDCTVADKKDFNTKCGFLTKTYLSGMSVHEPTSLLPTFNSAVDEIKTLKHLVQVWGGGERGLQMAMTLQKLKSAIQKGKKEMEWQRDLKRMSKDVEFAARQRVLNGLKDEILETRKKIRIAEVRIEKKKAIVQKPFDCKEIHHLKGEIEKLKRKNSAVMKEINCHPLTLSDVDFVKHTISRITKEFKEKSKNVCY